MSLQNRLFQLFHGIFQLFHGILEFWWNFKQLWWNFGGILWPDPTYLGIPEKIRFPGGLLLAKLHIYKYHLVSDYPHHWNLCQDSLFLMQLKWLLAKILWIYSCLTIGYTWYRKSGCVWHLYNVHRKGSLSRAENMWQVIFSLANHLMSFLPC